MSNTVSFIVMLDTSASMSGAESQLKIDAKAFVGCALPKDQFGVNQFNSNASWVYPAGNNPDIVTVTTSHEEIDGAADEIEKVKCDGGSTNIGDAISLANVMIKQAQCDINAFVLLSDGQHNAGPNPINILSDEPPIFIGALGSVEHRYFDELLQKNKKSKLYACPNVADMMKMFNDIRGDASQSLTVYNQRNKCSKNNFTIDYFEVSEKNNNVQLNIVWSNSKYRYTSKNAGENLIKVYIADSNFNTMDFKPEIIGNGYCVFNLAELKPGKWHCITEFSLQEDIDRTVGIFDYNSSIKFQVDMPKVVNSGESVTACPKVLYKDLKIESCIIKTVVTAPLYSVDGIMAKYKNELDAMTLPEGEEKQKSNDIAKLQRLREQKLQELGFDIYETKKIYSFSLEKTSGNYEYAFYDAKIPGIYSFEFIVEGINPETQLPFTAVKTCSMVIGSQ